MAAVDEKVMRFVEDVLDEEPDIELEELYRRAQDFSGIVGHLSRRQFNARYPLQVKRRRALAARKPKAPSRRETPTAAARPARPSVSPNSSRDHIRAVLLQFASDLVGAEERKDLVRVLADVDRYVDTVLDEPE